MKEASVVESQCDLHLIAATQLRSSSESLCSKSDARARNTLTGECVGAFSRFRLGSAFT